MTFDPDLYQNKYRISSPRAEWWDYYEGIYFVTIVTKNRRNYFGNITYNADSGKNELNLSQLGKFVDLTISKISDHEWYSYIPVWVVMPNHIHLIIMIDIRGRHYRNDGSLCTANDGGLNMDGIINDDSSVKSFDSSVKSFDSSVKSFDSSVKSFDSSVKSFDSSVKSFDSSTVETCDSHVSTVKNNNINNDNINDDNIKRDRRTPEFMASISPKTGSLALVIGQFKRAITIYANKNNIPFAWQPRYYESILKDQIGFDRVRRYIDNNVKNWKSDKFNA